MKKFEEILVRMLAVFMVIYMDIHRREISDSVCTMAGKFIDSIAKEIKESSGVDLA